MQWPRKAEKAEKAEKAAAEAGEVNALPGARLADQRA